MTADGGDIMAKMGRPKVDEPADRKVTVRFKDKEYTFLLEYAKHRDMTVTQVIRSLVESQIFKDQK